MSKSLGNSPNPVALMERYGADSVRMGMLMCAHAGQDLLFDEHLCAQGRNFANKIWNALRLIKGWDIQKQGQPDKKSEIATQWFAQHLGKAVEDMDRLYTKFRLSDIVLYCYKLIWEDFCNAYLEMIKPKKTQPIHAHTLSKTEDFFEILVKLLHPFMPFITEEIWHLLRKRKTATCLAIAPFPQKTPYDAKYLREMNHVLRLVNESRRVIASLKMQKSALDTLYIRTQHPEQYQAYLPIVEHLLSLRQISFTQENIPQTQAYTVGKDECFLPVENTASTASNDQKEHMEKKLKHLKTFLTQVEAKLTNKQFVAHAPEKIVLLERKKAQDAKEKIKVLEKLTHEDKRQP